MKNKILIPTILLMMLLLPFSVFGAWTYDRTPTGYEITSPVSFEISFDDITTDMLLNASTTWWGIQLNELYFTGGYEGFSECVPVSTKDYTFVLDIPIGCIPDYIFINGDPTSKANCETNPLYQDEARIFETDDEGVFEIVAPPRPLVASFEDMPENAIASTTAYIGDLFGTFGVFVWLAIGIPLAFWIINNTINLFTKGKKAKIRK